MKRKQKSLTCLPRGVLEDQVVLMFCWPLHPLGCHGRPKKPVRGPETYRKLLGPFGSTNKTVTNLTFWKYKDQIWQYGNGTVISCNFEDRCWDVDILLKDSFFGPFEYLWYSESISMTVFFLISLTILMCIDMFEFEWMWCRSWFISLHGHALFHTDSMHVFGVLFFWV